jgi:hypothetical protein
VRYCAHCGSQLSALRADRNALYCSDSCRVLAFRANKVEQARAVLDTLREPPPPLSARAVTAALNSPDPVGSGWEARRDWVLKHHDAAVKSFGPDVITAAARPVPAGTCRWHIATMAARVHGTKSPTYDRATRLLLGDACPRCISAIRAGLKARVDSVRGTSAVPTAGQGRPAGLITARRGVPPSRYGVTAGGGGVCCQIFADTGNKHWRGCPTRRERR